MTSIYPAELKEHLIGRMLGPERMSLTELSRETGVGMTALSRWRSKARSVARMTNEPERPRERAGGPRRPQDWTPHERLRAVVETASRKDEDLGAWLRHEGLHAATIAQWREAALRGLGVPHTAASGSSASDAKRMKDLERELRRKDRALAEAAALLVLQGKVKALWEEEGGSTGRS